MTLQALADMIREEAPECAFSIEECPMIEVPIQRTFFGRVYAAIRNSPVTERFKNVGLVRVTLIHDGIIPIQLLRNRADEIRSVGVVVEFHSMPSCIDGQWQCRA